MPGKTVYGESFFGRRNELAQLDERLNNEQSVLVVGERRIGKTSLLYESHKRSAVSARERHLYLDAQSFSTVGRLLASVAEYLGNQKPPELPLAMTVDELGSDPLVVALKRARRAGRHLTLFINDLDDLLARSPESEGGRYLTSFLRSTIEEGHVVVCGVAFRSMLVEPLSPAHAPLFNVFHPITLRSFDDDEALDLLVTNSRKSGNALSSTECSFVMEVAGRKPFHLQELGFRLFSLGFRDSIGSQRLELLEDAANFFAMTMQDHWQHTLESLSATHRSALIGATAGEPVSDPSSYSYLVNRGLLDEGTSQFSSMGSLFHAFTRELGAEIEQRNGWEGTVTTMKEIANSAVKTAVGAAVKAILS